LADRLLQDGYRVRALDNLSAQVHGSDRKRPDYLAEDVELLVGDIRDRSALRQALKGADAVYHFATNVGVGQSMYEVADYVSTNNLGTAILLEELIRRPVERLVVSSSMSIYGEGLYKAPDGTIHMGVERTLEQLRSGNWELTNKLGDVLTPIPTPETKTPALWSIYALSKYDQERMCQMIGTAYNIPTVVLRFFNVFGIRQSLSNPYTGVLAIFACRLLNDNPPLIYEDGRQLRDFVSVHDIAEACKLALEVPQAAGHAFNIASDRQYRIKDVARLMSRTFGKEHVQPMITGKYRVGDIRHCFADISLARTILGYQPRIMLEDGIAEIAEWLRGQAACDRFEQAYEELNSRGLTV